MVFDFNKDYYNAIMRSMPVIMVSSSIFDFFNGVETIWYPASLLVVEFLTRVEKDFFKVIMGDGEFSILGSGSRPKGAKNCGAYIMENNLNKPASSYGMPSGHAQVVSTVATYQVLKHNYDWKSWGWVLIAFLTCISRYQLGCHTWQQIIVGIVFGIICGYFIYSQLVLTTSL
jgi:membrane-associated phospholipid phosphatase